MAHWHIGQFGADFQRTVVRGAMPLPNLPASVAEFDPVSKCYLAEPTRLNPFAVFAGSDMENSLPSMGK
jgi:hypothetical protein